MMHPAFDPMDIAGLHLWLQEESDDNGRRRQRLLHNLTKAVAEELTPRQREMLPVYYSEQLNMVQLAARLLTLQVCMHIMPVVPTRGGRTPCPFTIDCSMKKAFGCWAAFWARR